ncbi:MAG: site-specific integrase [Phycisphaerae bacterium]|nr:site-specific integrase [Phycisphaerae bacterium]
MRRAKERGRERRRARGAGSIFRRREGSPWLVAWVDHDGRRRELNTRTLDRATAARILAKRIEAAAVRREGLVDPAMDRIAEASRSPLTDHVAAYVTHCRNVGQDAHSLNQKERHLLRFVEASGAKRIADLNAEALASHMRRFLERGRSARTANFIRQIAIAFGSWLVRTGRAEANAMRTVPKRDEQIDRRRRRRALTDDELERLLNVARSKGREALYLAAGFAGLRRGDLESITWADVDLTAGTLTIRGGKAKRLDVLPIHPQLADALATLRVTSPALPTVRVFPDANSLDRMRREDFIDAGLAHWETVTDAKGEPLRYACGALRRRFVAIDENGDAIDLHALRTTLGTKLARAGVAPQVAQRVMRHGDYRTTLRHYTVLGLTDTSKAVSALPAIGAGEARATGTTDAAPDGSARLTASVRPATSGRGVPERADKTAPPHNSRGRAKGLMDADLCRSVPVGSEKRATRLELATFSLEG